MNISEEKKWHLVDDCFAFESHCEDCMYLHKKFWGDTGWEVHCDLLYESHGRPEDCQGFDYMLECYIDEVTEHD